MATVPRKSIPRKAPAAKAPTKRSRSPGPVTTKAAAKPLNPSVPAPTPNPTSGAAGSGSGKAEKTKKTKLVRDSFTIPKAEYVAIDVLKQRAAKLGKSPKKSELLRAGLMLMTQLGDEAFGKALAAVPTIKTGRPKA